MALKFGGKSKSTRGDDEGVILCMTQSLFQCLGHLWVCAHRPMKLRASAQGGTLMEGSEVGSRLAAGALHLLERGQEGHLDILIFISMRAPAEYRAGPPVKLRHFRHIHFVKIGHRGFGIV